MAESGETFSSMIQDVRNELSLTQEGLARELGVSYVTVNRWENGRTNPSMLARARFEEFCKRKAEDGSLRHTPTQFFSSADMSKLNRAKKS